MRGVRRLFGRIAETLWAHAVACTPRNCVAYHGLGRVLAERGKFDEAMTYYRQAMEGKPDYTAAV